MSILNVDELKRVACSAIDDAAQMLHQIADSIFSHPELAFQEHHAHEVLTNFLENSGFSVERSYIIPTGFRATFDCGSSSTVAVLCEYDALPEIGHACGHNLIAEVGIGAGLGIKTALQAAKRLNMNLGRVSDSNPIGLYN